MTAATLPLSPPVQTGSPADGAFGRRLFAAAFAVGVHALALAPLLTSGPAPVPAAPQAIMVGVSVETQAVRTTTPHSPAASAPSSTAAPQRSHTVSTTAPASERSIAVEAKPAAEAQPTASTSATANAQAEAEAAVEPPRYQASYLNNPQPPYPLMSKRQHEEGTVRLHVMVDANGRAEIVKIKTGSGYERLDLAARAAVQEWRFVPARQRGQNVAGWVEVPIQFQLEK